MSAEAYWNHEISENQGFYTVFNYNNFSYDEDNDFKNENPLKREYRLGG